MFEVLRHDFHGGVRERVRRDAVIPVGGDLLPVVVVERVPAIPIGGGAEKGLHGRKVGAAGWAEGGEELVEEGGGAEEEEIADAEEEVAVLGQGLLVALVAIQGQVVAVEVAVTGVLHVAKKGAVEGVVVAVG